jgi:hypothetical protein
LTESVRVVINTELPQFESMVSRFLELQSEYIGDQLIFMILQRTLGETLRLFIETSSKDSLRLSLHILSGPIAVKNVEGLVACYPTLRDLYLNLVHPRGR